MVYCVKDFEQDMPAEDVRRADTAAIQNAIDACSLTGGTVMTEEGKRYLIHTIVLKSGVKLELSKGTVLEASGRIDDYQCTLDEHGRESSMERYTGRPVHAAVYAMGEHDIAVTGEGCIEGRSELFVSERTRYISTGEPYPRPTLIYTENCENVTFMGITLQNAPFWTLHTAGCRSVLIDSVKILNRLDMANSDGIDPDHCKDVVIRNCVIQSADDCICMKNTADNHSYGACEGILIENCELTSTSAAVKIGTEGVDSFRNILVRNCRIRKSNRGLVIQIRDGGSVSDVRFEHIEIETRRFQDGWWGRGEPIMVSSVARQEGMEAGTIQNVVFHDIRCTSENGICIYSSRPGKIRDLLFEEVEVSMGKNHKWEAGQYDLRPCADNGILQKENYAVWNYQGENICMKDCCLILPKERVKGFAGFVEDETGGLTQDNVEKVY